MPFAQDRCDRQRLAITTEQMDFSLIGLIKADPFEAQPFRSTKLQIIKRLRRRACAWRDTKCVETPGRCRSHDRFFRSIEHR